MRIIIDIDPEGITVRTSETEEPLGIEALSASPPPEILERAERIGALSAGVAPLRLGLPDILAASASAKTGAEAESMDAGGAVEGTSAQARPRTTKSRPKTAARRTKQSKR